MKHRLWVLLPALFLMLYSCVEDRDFNIVPTAADEKVNVGMVLVNEIMARGSTLLSEFGDSTDWVELYNPGTDTVVLASGRWYMSDSIPGPFEFLLPGITIPPLSYYIIRCDGRDTVASQVHTNFSLSSNGEDVGLFYKSEAGPVITIDSHTFGPQLSGVSIGRLPDGSNTWGNCSSPSPGVSNH